MTDARHGGQFASTAAEIHRLVNALIITPLRFPLAAELRVSSGSQVSTLASALPRQARRSYYQHRLATELGP